MTLESEMTVNSKREWKRVICPVLPTPGGDACGEWCAWYGEESLNVTVATCQGRPIGELIEEKQP